MATNMRQSVVILGSTGSIGANTLEVIRRFGERFRLVGIAADRNIAALHAQIERHKPEYVAVYNKEMADALRRACKRVNVFSGLEGLCRLASLKGVDTVVMSMAGSVALVPLIEAIKSGKKIALANKESLVVGGHIVQAQLMKNKKACIVPIDSEQNAIFQCLRGYERSMVRSLYLTASGGPLVHYTKRQLRAVSPEVALAHPRWKMGRKISVDSATLMNKGLEVIEAKWLFDMPLTSISVIIHREAIIHSLVEFIDGSVLGQLGVTDMRLPIQYALSFPERWHNNGHLKLDLFRLKSLSFEQPDVEKFPCLRLAYDAARQGLLSPCVLNTANEEAVAAFLGHRLAFGKIPFVIEKLLAAYKGINGSHTLDDVLKIEAAVRQETRALIQRHPPSATKIVGWSPPAHYGGRQKGI